MGGDRMLILHVRQVAIADRIVINKKDLLKEGELESLKEDLTAINTVADMIVTERSKYAMNIYLLELYLYICRRIPLDYVLDINAYDVSNADALVHQTEKIQEHGSHHAHQISHVRRPH